MASEESMTILKARNPRLNFRAQRAGAARATLCLEAGARAVQRQALLEVWEWEKLAPFPSKSILRSAVGLDGKSRKQMSIYETTPHPIILKMYEWPGVVISSSIARAILTPT